MQFEEAPRATAVPNVSAEAALSDPEPFMWADLVVRPAATLGDFAFYLTELVVPAPANPPAVWTRPTRLRQAWLQVCYLFSYCLGAQLTFWGRAIHSTRTRPGAHALRRLRLAPSTTRLLTVQAHRTTTRRLAVFRC